MPGVDRVASTQTYMLWRAFIDRASKASLHPYDWTRLNEVIIAWHERGEPIDHDQMITDLVAFEEGERLEVVNRIYHGVELLEQYDAR